MAIEVIQFAKPHLWASLVAGGSLTVAQTYYFMGFALRGSGYYGMANSPASEEISLTPTAGNQTIKIEWWQDGGNVTAYANPGGGQVTVTVAAAHGRSNGDTAYIRGTTNYDGTYTIANVTANTFEITVAWVADDGASKWFADIGYHSRAHGMGFKWDKFTMIDAGDGKPYQWQNLNDPAVVGGEFDEGHGHRRWTIEYHRRYHTGNSINFTQEAITAAWVSGYLYDGTALGSTAYSNRAFSMLDIAWRKTYYPVDSLWTEYGGKLCIYCTGAGNTIRTFIDALKASGYDDMFLIGEGNYTWNVGLSATFLGSVFTDAGSATELNDCTIDLIGGQFCFSSWSDAGTMVVNRSKIIQHGLAYNSQGSPRAEFNDTELVNIGTYLILDYVATTNFAPKMFSGWITYYNKVVSGVKIIGGYGTLNFQWRYQRMNNDSSMTDFYFKDLYMFFVDNPGSYTGKMTNVEFVNNGLQSYDVQAYKGYITGDCDKIMECLNVTCDRADGKIIVYSPVSPHTVTDLWNMRFKIDLSILDEGGNPINGADINLSWSGGSDTDTSDASGIAEVTGLSYTINWDNTMGAGYGVTSAYKDLTLTVIKAGYQKYKSVFTMQEGKDLVIRLKHSNVCVDQEVMLS